MLRAYRGALLPAYLIFRPWNFCIVSDAVMECGHFLHTGKMNMIRKSYLGLLFIKVSVIHNVINSVFCI